MESKVQEHQQELQRMQQASQIDKNRLTHEAKLKKEAKEVSEISGVAGRVQVGSFAHCLVHYVNMQFSRSAIEDWEIFVGDPYC